MWICVLSLESGYVGTMQEWGDITRTFVISVVKLPKILSTKTAFFHIRLYTFETSETRQNVDILRQNHCGMVFFKGILWTCNVLHKSKKNKTTHKCGRKQKQLKRKTHESVNIIDHNSAGGCHSTVLTEWKANFCCNWSDLSFQRLLVCLRLEISVNLLASRSALNLPCVIFQSKKWSTVFKTTNY